MAAKTFFDINAMIVELEQLERQERHVSDTRRRLHDRLDAFPNDSLRTREREISEARLSLHRRIDELRAQLELDGR
ncbi:MAG TPA: hypothetical protein VGC78_10955 [Gaiellaceae bacterium]|jgi:hypothetical protein